MMFIADNQLPLILLFFLIGVVVTLFLFRKPKGHRAWLIADLIWVLLGGFGAIIAVLAGIYSADSSRIDRQIDLAYAATTAFDRDAARFRLRFCDPARDPDLAILCEKVEFLSASTAANSELPLFIAVTGQVAPLQGLNLVPGGPEDTGMEAMRETADTFDPNRFLVFTALDTPTQAALSNLQRKIPAIAGDFQILARAYDALITEVAQVKTEWEYLQSHAHILVLQIIALCLVSFAAPFRLGKSITDLRRR